MNIPVFHKNIRDELKNNRSNYLQVSGRTAFVRMIPGFSTTGNHTEKYIISSISTATGNSYNFEFKNIYTPGANFRAIPGIKDISIEFKNKMGTVRKATINWFCPSKTQLEELSIYFLQSGLTVYLDWGWINTKYDNLIPKLPDWFIKNDITVTNIYDKIVGNPTTDIMGNIIYKPTGLVFDTYGNYDGFIGIIMNFSFSMNPDGSYECKTDIASPGVLGEGIATDNVVHTGIKDKSPVNNFMEYLKNKFYPQLFADSFKQLTGDNYITFLDINEYAKYFAEKGKYKANADEAALPSQLTDEQLQEFMTDSPSYISWGYIEDNILSNSISGLSGLTFNSANSLLVARKDVYPILRTTDLSTCIVPFNNSKFTDVTIDIKIPIENFVSSGVSSTGKYTATPQTPALKDIELEFKNQPNNNIAICEPDKGRGGSTAMIFIPGMKATLEGSVKWAKAIYNTKFRNNTKISKIICIKGPDNDYPTYSASKSDTDGLSKDTFTGIQSLYIVAHSSGVWTANYILNTLYEILKNMQPITYVILDNDFFSTDKQVTSLNGSRSDGKYVYTIGGSKYDNFNMKLYYVYSFNISNKEIRSWYTKNNPDDPNRFLGINKIAVPLSSNDHFVLHCQLVNTQASNVYVKSVNEVSSGNVCNEYIDYVHKNRDTATQPQTLTTSTIKENLDKIYNESTTNGGILSKLSRYIYDGTSSSIPEELSVGPEIRSFINDDKAGRQVYDKFIDKYLTNSNMSQDDIKLFKILFMKYGEGYDDLEIIANYGAYYLLFLLPTLFDISNIKDISDLSSKFISIYEVVMKDVKKVNNHKFVNDKRIIFYHHSPRIGSYNNEWETTRKINNDGSVYSSYFRPTDSTNNEAPYFNSIKEIFNEKRLTFIKEIYIPFLKHINKNILMPLKNYYVTEYYKVVDNILLGGYRNSWADKDFRQTISDKYGNGNINNITKLVTEYVNKKIIDPIFWTDGEYEKKLKEPLYYNAGVTKSYGAVMDLLKNDSVLDVKRLTNKYTVAMNSINGNGLNVIAGFHLESDFKNKFSYAYQMLHSMINMPGAVGNVIAKAVGADINLSLDTEKSPSKLGTFNLSNDTVITPEEALKIKRSRNLKNEFKINFDFYTGNTPPTFRRILINSEFFRTTMLNNKTILDGVANILKRVNRALSYYWNLEIYYDESRRSYYIADANTTANTPPEIYEFKIYSNSPDDHLVKSISFSTKTSVLAAVNTFFAATKSNNESGIIGLGNEVIFDGLYRKNTGVVVKDMFYTDIKKDDSMSIDLQKLCDESALNLYNSHLQQFFANKMLIFLPIPFTYKIDGKSATINRWDAPSNLNIKTASKTSDTPDNKSKNEDTKKIQLYGDAGLRILLNKKIYRDDTDIISMIVPIEMEIEILGISGINIGECFTIDYMPEVFKKTGLFFVSGVSHSVSNNIWTTKLKASFRIIPNVKG